MKVEFGRYGFLFVLFAGDPQSRNNVLCTVAPLFELSSVVIRGKEALSSIWVADDCYRE